MRQQNKGELQRGLDFSPRESVCVLVFALAGFVTSERRCCYVHHCLAPRLGVRCLNVTYWCVENNQLNAALHYLLFAFYLTKEQILHRGSFECEWAPL